MNTVVLLSDRKMHMLIRIKTQKVLIHFYLSFLLHVIQLLKCETEAEKKVFNDKEISHAFREHTEIFSPTSFFLAHF